MFLLFQPKAYEHLCILLKGGKLPSNVSDASENRVTVEESSGTTSDLSGEISTVNPVITASLTSKPTDAVASSVGNNSYILSTPPTSSFYINDPNDRESNISYMIHKYSELDEYNLFAIMNTNSITHPNYNPNTRLESVD